MLELVSCICSNTEHYHLIILITIIPLLSANILYSFRRLLFVALHIFAGVAGKNGPNRFAKR